MGACRPALDVAPSQTEGCNAELLLEVHGCCSRGAGKAGMAARHVRDIALVCLSERGPAISRQSCRSGVHFIMKVSSAPRLLGQHIHISAAQTLTLS